MFCAMTAITAHTCNKGIFYYMMNYQSIKGHDFELAMYTTIQHSDETIRSRK